MCAQWRRPECDACCRNLRSPISSARQGRFKVTTWTGRTFLFPARLLLAMISLSIYSSRPSASGDFTSGRAVPGRAGPGRAGPGRAVPLLHSHCVLCSPQYPHPSLTRSLYQLIRSLCCPSAGLVSPVSLYLCFACRSRPPPSLPFPSSSPPPTPSPCFPPPPSVR